VNSTVRTVMFWVFIGVCLLLLWSVVQKGTSMGKPTEIIYSDLLDKIEAGQVQKATIQGTDVHGQLKGAKDEFHTVISSNNVDSLSKELRTAKIPFEIKEPQNSILIPILINLGPFVLLIGIWFFFMRQMQSGGNKALSFGKSRARLLSMQQKKITFKDVAGVDEAKEELKEIIEYLREPQKFQKLGGRIPKGVLLVGPPEPAKRCWRGPWPAKQTCRSSPSPVQTLWRCLWEWAQAAFATCLSRARRMRRALSLSTKSTQWAAIAARAWAAGTTSASRH